MLDPEFLHGSFQAHATMMSVCVTEMAKAVDQSAGLGGTVDNEAMSASFLEYQATLRPLIGTLERLLSKVERRRTRSLAVIVFNDAAPSPVDSRLSLEVCDTIDDLDEDWNCDSVGPIHEERVLDDPAGAPPAAEGGTWRAAGVRLLPPKYNRETHASRSAGRASRATCRRSRRRARR